jgi:uncharacterized membrane protein YeaQ/YmgE (transglycosylase-associated protein family)
MSDLAKSVIAWVIVGLFAGWLANIANGGGGLLFWVIAGLIGSVVGGFLAQQLKISLGMGNPFLERVIVSALGAVVVLIIARIIT